MPPLKNKQTKEEKEKEKESGGTTKIWQNVTCMWKVIYILSPKNVSI
jgi:hypothetical protein